MKRIKTAAIFFLAVSGAAALGERTFFQKLNKIPNPLLAGKSLELDKSLKKDIEKFLEKSDSIPASDFLQNRELVHAAKVYIGLCGGYEAKKKNELFWKSSDIVMRYEMRGEMKCRDNDKTKALQLQRAVQITKIGRDLNDAAVNEEILALCPYDVDALWSLLSNYRYKNQREKYNELMLRLVREDQVEFDHFFEPPDDLGSLALEYYLFYIVVNPPGSEMNLTAEQATEVADAVLTKHRRLFDVTERFFATEDGEYDERIEDAVKSLAVLYDWADRFDLKEHKARMKKEFFEKKEIRERIEALKADARYAPIVEKIMK